MEMYYYKCKDCGTPHHPKHFVCKNCGGAEFEELPLEGEATVLTWTKVYNLPEGYMKPYLNFVIAQFDNGLRVSGQCTADPPHTGMRVKSAVCVVKEGVGRDYYGFIFEPAE